MHNELAKFTMNKKIDTIRNYCITTSSDIEKEFVLRRLNCELGFSKINPEYLIHKAFCLYRKTKWRKQASTKTKSEVSGGGKKPWPQKGRGRARAGSSRSPLWRGGGVCFGPKPTINNLKMNNLEYDQAFRSLLFEKQKSIIPISLFETVKVSNNANKILNSCTKNSKQILSNIFNKNNLNPVNILGFKEVTIIVNTQEFNLLEKSLFLQAIQNIPKLKLVKDSELNLKDLLRSKYLLITAYSLHNLTQKNLSWKKIKI